jgi:hypothetical protein
MLPTVGAERIWAKMAGSRFSGSNEYKNRESVYLKTIRVPIRKFDIDSFDILGYNLFGVDNAVTRVVCSVNGSYLFYNHSPLSSSGTSHEILIYGKSLKEFQTALLELIDKPIMYKLRGANRYYSLKGRTIATLNISGLDYILDKQVEIIEPVLEEIRPEFKEPTYLRAFEVKLTNPSPSCYHYPNRSEDDGYGGWAKWAHEALYGEDIGLYEKWW